MTFTPEQIEMLRGLAVSWSLNIATALLILLLGWLAARWAGRGVSRMLGRFESFDATLKPLVATVTRSVVLIFVAVLVLAEFGVQTASIIAVLGAAGLAVGLALQGTLANVAAGVMLLVLRPFKHDEYIDADGIAGTIMEVGLFTTTMRTFDGLYLSAPNSRLFGARIINYSRLPTRRVDIPVAIAYHDDIARAKKILMEVIAADSRALAEPAPVIHTRLLGDNGITLNMRCWVPQETYWDAMSDLTQAAREALDAAGITIPFPQRELRIVQAPGGAPLATGDTAPAEIPG